MAVYRRVCSRRGLVLLRYSKKGEDSRFVVFCWAPLVLAPVLLRAWCFFDATGVFLARY